MDYNHAKPSSSNQYGDNYYAPPPMYQKNSDFESNSTQNSNNNYGPYDSDAMNAMKAEQAQTNLQKDKAGMYVPIFPQNKIQQDYTVHYQYPDQNKPIYSAPSYQVPSYQKPGSHHHGSCSNCYDCQMRMERERKQRQEEEECEMCMKCFCECALMCCLAFCEAQANRN